MTVSMVAADLTKWVAWGPIRVYEIFGRNNQSADLYIQLHQVYKDDLTSTSTVPEVKSLETLGNLGFKYSFPGGLPLSELTVAISTTETLYTAVGAGGGLDLTLVIDTLYSSTGVSVAGDLTTDVGALQVWAAANGPKLLLRADVKNNDGALNIFACLSAKDTTYTSSIMTPAIVGPGTTRQLNFGPTGLYPYSRDAQTDRLGGTLFLAPADVTVVTNISSPMTAIEAGSPSANIRAYYK